MLYKSTLLASVFALGALVLARQDESAEPALRVKLVLGDKTQEVNLGESFELKLGDQVYEGSLQAAATRIFDKRGIRFEYPSHFTYEYEADEDHTIFTVEGPETFLMVQIFPTEIDPDSLAKLMANATIAEFGDLEVDRSEIEHKLGGLTLRGERVKASISSAAFVQDFLGIAGVEEGSTTVLVFQGGLDESGALASESAKALELLGETLVLAD